jgi:ABC-2 type transport system permease protein
LQVISGVAKDTSLELQLLDGIRQMGEMQAANPQADQTFQADRVMAQAKAQFERSRSAPLIKIVQGKPEQSQSTGIDLSFTFVPGITVLFVFLAAQTVAHSIFEERQSGSLRRLLSAPVRRWELLAGKLLPVFLLTLIQIGVIFLVGAFLLPLLGIGQMGVGDDPLAWALTSIVMALCSTSLGILIVSLARSEGQITGLSNALLWVAGFLGGALIPTFFLDQIPVLSFLSRLMPQYWATSAYYDILSRGKGLADVLPNLGILLGFTALFFFIGQRRFRFE